MHAYDYNNNNNYNTDYYYYYLYYFSFSISQYNFIYFIYFIYLRIYLVLPLLALHVWPAVKTQHSTVLIVRSEKLPSLGQRQDLNQSHGQTSYSC